MPEVPAIGQQIQKLDERSADVSKQIAGVNEQMGSNATAREAATAPLLKGVEQAQGDAAQFIERRQAGRPVIPEFKPQPPIDAKEFQGLSYALIGMAMIGGAVSKGNWLGVADTLNGAMKGFIDGNKALADKNVKDYEQQFKSAAAKEQQWVRETEDVLKAKNLSINQKLTQIRIVAAQYDKQDMLAQGRLKSLEGAQRALDSQKTTLTGLQQRHEDNMAKLHERAQARRQHEEMIGALRGGNSSTQDMYNVAGKFGLTPDGFEKAVDRYNADGTLPPTRNQKNFPLLTAIMNRQAEKYPDSNVAVNKTEFKGISAAYQQNEQRESAVERTIGAVKELTPRFEELSKKVNTSIGGKFANQTINDLKTKFGDNSDIQELKNIAFAMSREYVIATTMPGSNAQMHTTHAAEAEKMLNGNMPLNQMKGAIAGINADMKASEDSLKKNRDRLSARLRDFGKPGAGAEPAAPAPAAAPPGDRRQDILNRASPEQRKELEKAWGKTSSADEVTVDYSELTRAA